MWLLKSLSGPDKTFYLLSNNVYVVGRKDCEIVLPSDQAVSRKHAQIKVSHPESNISKPDRLPVASLTDLSKFGTWHNNVKLNKEEEITLNDGDQVIFGSPRSSFRVVYEPFIISTSCLDNPSKKLMRTLVTSLGGHLVSEWCAECSLLVMNNLSVTIKVISALVSQKHIVTPAYIENFVQHIKEGGPMPEPDLYLPNISETQINPDQVSFKPDIKRASVFQGMKFIFLNSKQFKKMNLTIEMGGGLPILMDEPCDDDLEMMVEPGSVVMQSNPSDASQGFSQQNIDWITKIIKYLKKHKKHVIQDAELGFAVLHCSTEQHCNPDVPFMSQIPQPHMPSQSLTQTDVLALNTEPGARSPVIESKDDSDKINETKIKPKIEKCEKITTQKESKKTDTKLRRQISENETARETTQLETMEPSNFRNSASTDTLDGQCLGRQIKKEKITPEKREAVRRSPRRSPSPANLRVSAKRLTERSQRSPSPVRRSTRRSPSPTDSRDSPKKSTERSPSPVRQNLRRLPSPENLRASPKKSTERPPSPSPWGETASIRKSDQNKTGSKTTDVKVESRFDSLELSSVYETERNKESVTVDLKKDEWSSKQKKTQKTESKSMLKKPYSARGSPATSTSSGKTREKRRIIVEDSDDEDPPSIKRSRNEPQMEDEEDLFEVEPSQSRNRPQIEDEEDLFDVKPSQSRGAHARTDSSDVDEGDLFDVDDSTLSKEHQQKSTQVKRSGRNLPLKAGSDEGVLNLSEESPEKSTKTSLEKTAPNRQIGRTNGDSKIVRMKEKPPEVNGQTEDRINRSTTETPEGFLNTKRHMENVVIKSEVVKEEDLPSRCIITKFVDLVARPVRSAPPDSGEATPSGYIRWKGKLVRNFKKFRKNQNCGSNDLPRIIGGSDLQPHVPAQRKETDEWFREALEAESQQSEAERRAQELFDYEPSKAAKKRR